MKDKKERIGRMLLMHANHREDIKDAYTGDIVALAGLEERAGEVGVVDALVRVQLDGHAYEADGLLVLLAVIEGDA